MRTLKVNLSTILSILFIYSSSQVYSQTIRRIDFIANDIVYSPSQDCIFATAPQQNKTYGNLLCRINPNNGSVLQSLYVGTNPTNLAISDDGQYLYVGLERIPRIIRVKLPEMKIDLSIAISDTSSSSVIAHSAGEIKVFPNKPTSFAYVSKSDFSSPSFRYLRIYDDNVKRQKEGYDRIYFPYASTMTFIGKNVDSLYCATNEVSTRAIYSVPISAQGFESESANAYERLDYRDYFLRYSRRDSLLYTGAKVLNPFTTPRFKEVHTFNITETNFSYSRIITEPDPFGEGVFLSHLSDSKLLVRRFHAKTRLQTNEWTLLQNTQEQPKQLVNLGKTEKLALISNKSLFLINNNCVSTITTVPSIAQTSPLSICRDSSVLLTANTNNSVLWSNGDTTKSIAVKEGKYLVAFMDAQGCAGAFSSPITVNIGNVDPPYVYSTDITNIFDLNLCQGETISLQHSSTNPGTTTKWSTGEVTPRITISQPGTYYTINTNGKGCTVNSFPITVKYKNLTPPPKPVIAIIGKTDLCNSNESVTLHAPSGYMDYQWTNSRREQLQTVNTFFRDSLAVRVTDTNGCKSIYSNFVTYRLLSQPSKPILIYKDSLLQLSNTTTNTQYRWFFNGDLIPNITAATYKPTSGGFYSVQAYNGQCESPFSELLSVALPIKTSTTDFSEGYIQIYPNPTGGFLRLQILSVLRGGSIEVVNMLGQIKQIEKIDTLDNQITLDISSLEKGSYNVLWKTNDGMVRSIKKIIKL
jgi:Secretion system C-terminal sorting domain